MTALKKWANQVLRLSFYLCISLALLYSLVVATSFHVLAANKPVAKSTQKPAKLIPHIGNEIYPAWYFLGCGTGWNKAVDGNLQGFEYAYTTGSQACSSAVWDYHEYTQGKTCSIFVYIPTIFATANISYGLYGTNGQLLTRATINQNDFSGWKSLIASPGVYGIHHVLISSNNGENQTYMAAGGMTFTCQ